MPIRLLSQTPRKHKTLSYRQQDCGNLPEFIYGKFGLDYTINYEGLAIAFEETGGMYHYWRNINDWKYETRIAVTDGNCLIHPVEPLNLPENVTDFLEISFDEIRVEPRGKTIIFLTIPIEIGIFVESKDGTSSLLDVVTFTYPKYSLYGSANRGVITRWCKSPVYADPPLLRNHLQGTIRLEIENTLDEWVPVSRVVLYQKGLVLYYDQTTVSACAVMTITAPDVASVYGIDLPLRPEMTQCAQIFEPRKTTPFYNIPGMLVDKIFTMDMGLM
ncbi:MAG: DUF432 domain-containing protein [Methanocorpusculum sp.]|nr:DUF432 domain-containing protein [Methanocorpusculum sp.]